MTAIIFITCFLFLVPTWTAASSTSHDKFKHWFPYYEKVLNIEVRGIGGTSYNNCSATVTRYHQAQGIDAITRCYNVFDCLYEGLPAHEQSNFASAQVILGLTPTLLATIAPSLGEISMLSSQRPFLSFLLSLGCPAVFVPRLLGSTDPLHTLAAPSLAMSWVETMRSRTTAVVLLLQYTMVVVAIANVFELSWRLGLRTLVAWKCNSSYLPFLWSTLPVVIHLTAATAWHFSGTMKRIRGTAGGASGGNRHRHTLTVPHVGHISLYMLFRLFERECGLSIKSEKRNYRNQGTSAIERNGKSKRPVEWKFMFAMEAAEFMAFIHILFGTLVFSSLMFIATIDAMAVIVRYILSALVCRFVLMFEINGIRVVEDRLDG